MYMMWTTVGRWTAGYFAFSSISFSCLRPPLRKTDGSLRLVLGLQEFENFARHFLKAGPDAFFARLGRATVVQAGILPAGSVAIKHLLAASPAISPVPHAVLAPLLGEL